MKPTDSLRPPRSIEQALNDMLRERDIAKARGLMATSVGSDHVVAYCKRHIEALDRRIAMLVENTSLIDFIPIGERHV